MIVRNIDALGRIVIPAEMREKHKLPHRAPVEIHEHGDLIVLKRYDDRCRICGETRALKEFKGTKICQACINEVNK